MWLTTASGCTASVGLAKPSLLSVFLSGSAALRASVDWPPVLGQPGSGSFKPCWNRVGEGWTDGVLRPTVEPEGFSQGSRSSPLTSSVSSSRFALPLSLHAQCRAGLVSRTISCHWFHCCFWKEEGSVARLAHTAESLT